MTQTSKTIQFDGFTWNLRLPSNVDTEIAEGRWWDKDVHDLIVRHVKPGMCCLDAGANIGAFTMLLSRCVGPKGWVYAFEPCQAFYERLQGHIEANRLTNVTAKPIALGDKSGPAVCVQDGPPYYSTARVMEAGTGTAVECTALDEFWQTRGPLDFIKIDVDGCELELLHGADKTIKEHHPTIAMEVPLSEEGIRIGQWLTDRGYTMHHKGVIKAEQLGHSSVAGTLNLLALHKECK